MSSIVKKAFEFTTYDSPVPVGIGEGVLISYEVYTHEPCINCNNAIKITVHGPDGDITLDGLNMIYLKDYIREVEYNDLAHPEECTFEQQKDRTYRHSVTKNYCFVDNLGQVVENGQDEANRNKRIDTATVLNYLYKIVDSKDPADKHVFDWIASEIKRLKNEMKRLDILTASDEDIIQTALMEYGNKECYDNDTEIANRITNVREKYLKMLKNGDE